MQLDTLTPLQIQQLVVAIIGGGAFVLIIVLFVRMRRRMAREQIRASAQTDADAVLRGFRSRLNYASQLLHNERERMRYDRIRYSDSDAETMAGFLHDAEQRYQQTNQQLERALRTLPDGATEADYQQLVASVNELTPSIAPIEAALQQCIHHRSIVDAQILHCAERIDAVQREYQQLQHRLSTLGINHRLLLRDAEQSMQRANEHAAAHHYNDAVNAADHASQHIQLVGSSVTTLLDIRNGVLAGRQASDKAALQGFDVNESLRLFQEASGLLDQALAMMMSGEIAEGIALVDRAEQLRQHAVTQGGSQPVVHQRHHELLNELIQTGEQLRTQLSQAVVAFQQLKHCHPLLWDDLKNAGSEAVINAQFAAYYVTLAQQMHTAKRDDVPAVLSYAQQALNRANQIVHIMLQRHDDVQRIELLARQEYADAEELIDSIQVLVSTNTGDAAAHYPAIKQEFLAVQQCVDSIPFDGMSSYRMARLFVQRTLMLVPVASANTPVQIAERSQRIRDMLWRQIRLLEQFNTLHPLNETDTLIRGIQSIRHEANTFDVTWTTASDMTVPIISELSKLIQRYDRLDNAIIHIAKQLRHTLNARRKQQMTLFAALNSAITRIKGVADTQIRANALQRVRELDAQLHAQTITYEAVIAELQRMVDVLPSEPLHTQSYPIDPFPYLQMRYFAKVGAFVPPPGAISWIPNLPADPEW